MINISGDWFAHFVLIGILLFLAKIIKEKVPFLNKVIIPSALLAGFIGLVLSNGFLNVITIDRDTIINDIVYHGIAIGFIALTLKKAEGELPRKYWTMGIIIVLMYVIQAIIGFLITWGLFSNVFVGAGLLLPLGFGQGPGLATSIGSSWEVIKDSVTELDVGLLYEGEGLGASIAVMGFLWGGIIGVIVLNYIAKKHKLNINKIHSEKSNTVAVDYHFETIEEVRIFDALTAQIVIILVIYGCVYGTLYLIEDVLLTGKGIASTLAGLAHGFNFMFGILYAIILKQILRFFENRGKNMNFMTNNYILSNIGSIAFNFMITAAVLSITITAISEYYIFILVLTTIGGICTLFVLDFITKRVYKKHTYEYLLGLFGMLTGTASTGIALLKSVDRDLETPVADELVMGSGTAITMALPLFAILTFPTLALTVTNGSISVNQVWNVFTFGGLIVYAMILGLALYLVTKKGNSSSK